MSNDGTPITAGPHDEAYSGVGGIDPHDAGAGPVDPTAPHDSQLTQRWPDPGLPAHVYRSTDVDEKAAKRAERQVARMFLLSFAGTVIFLVGYFLFPLGDGDMLDIRYSTWMLGGGIGLALFSIGIGAIMWAKKLMPDDEIVEERHPVRSTDEEREGAVAILREGGEGTGFGRRKMIWGSLTAALGALALPAIVTLRDLGPLPGNAPSTTFWRAGLRLVRDPEGTPIRTQDIAIGGVVHVMPEGIEESAHPLAEKAKAAVLIIRLAPGEVEEAPDRKGWSHEGIFAYSKICTHVGCPVALYEQQTHHLLCPCHQSTFDVKQHCKVIFGPADRPLPQLAITADADGYLVAQSGFHEPVGPSFWERG
jgi:ubiquinol-cytochrome c reductase iron-sulfur subunit